MTEVDSEIRLVNHEPKDIYMKFEGKLLNSLPANQPDFIKLLERKELIGEKNKKKMNAPNQTRAGCAGCVLQEIDASTFCDEKFYKLLSVMKEYGHGLETLVLEIEAYLDPVGGHFDCGAMHHYLFKNHYSLEKLPYDQIKHDLVAHKVITYEEKRIMDQFIDKLWTTVFDNVQRDLYQGKSRKFKDFLQIMEDSNVPLLQDTAKRLGGSQRVPETIIKGIKGRQMPVQEFQKQDSQRNFKELYSQAINDLGSEELHLCKVVFFGPPGVGKSSLCRVLIKLPDSKRDSTGVFDLKLVHFKVEVTEDDTEQTSVWNIITLTEEIERLRSVIEEKLSKQKHPTVVQLAHSYKEEQSKSDLEDVLLPNVEKDKNIHKVICQKVSESLAQKEAGKTRNIILALYDSGGQPEFFDVMPLLHTLPTGNVMIFNMNEPLDAKINPQVYEKGHHVSTGEQTHYTNAELMKTALANIESSVTKQPSLLNNSILVVGTHLDEYMNGKENIEESLSQMDNNLSKAVLSDSARRRIIHYKRKGKEDRIVHPISNTLHGEKQDKVAQKIRTAIERMSESTNKRIEIPNSWLLFQYQIRLLGKPCVTLSDCQRIAKEVVNMKEDVKVVLRYFHELGMLLNYKELEDVVFCDPQWLFEQLSKIIRMKYNASYKADVENGIVSKLFMANNVYSNLEKDTNDIIKLDDLLRLFISLNIMVKVPENRFTKHWFVERYFMPALLDSAPQNFSLPDLGKKCYDTMYIIYKGTLFPRGMFCCIMVLLTQAQWNFTLMENNQCMHKNLIVFQDANENYLIMSDKINHVAIDIYQQKVHSQGSLLQEINCKLLQTLQKACEKMKLNYNFEFGFACQEKICQEKYSTESNIAIAIVELKHNFCPKVMRCRSCCKSVLLNYNQLLWFIPLNTLHVLKAEDSRPSDGKRKHRNESSDNDSEYDVYQRYDKQTSRQHKRRRIDKPGLQESQEDDVSMLKFEYQKQITSDVPESRSRAYDIAELKNTFIKDDVETAFIDLIAFLDTLWHEVDIETLKRIFKWDVRLPQGLKSELRSVSNLSEIFELIVCSQFCNWMELDILKCMAIAGGIREATYIISFFEECIHSRMCCDVILNFRKEYINPDVFENIIILLNKYAEVMTVAELMKKYHTMEAKLLLPTSSKAIPVPPTMTKVFLIPVGPSGEVKCDGKCGGAYQWEGHDFTIILPPDCADGTVTFTIEAYLPSSTQEHCIVSAVFKINTKINNFKKPITIRFPHWVNVKSEKERQSLHLLICHQDSCDIEKGYFEVGKKFGSVKVSKFSPIFVCIVLSLTIIKAYIYSLIAGSTQPQNITMMLEEGPITETTTKADNNDYLDLLILPLNKEWRKYCIIKNNATYCQAITQYLKNENWINPSISCQILKREVKFKPLTDDSVAKLCIVDESTDNKIIKFFNDTKISKCNVDAIENLQPITTYVYPVCNLHVITEMLISSPSQLKLKVDGLCGRNDECSEFSLASPTEYGYHFEIYQHHEPEHCLKKVFDYDDTAKKLKKQLDKLSRLKYDSMSRSLFCNDVITTEERQEIEGTDKANHKKMEYLIVDVIINSLKLGHGKKYKSFLKVMEESEDSDLRSVAKSLGGSESVPDDIDA